MPCQLTWCALPRRRSVCFLLAVVATLVTVSSAQPALRGRKLQDSIRKLQDSLVKPLDVQWMRQIGSIGSERAWAVASDMREDTVYVAGYTDGQMNTSKNTNETYEHTEAILVKLGPSGEQLWMRHWGSPGNDVWCVAATVDHLGFLYITGTTEGRINGKRYMGDRDVWLAKFTRDGDLDWLEMMGSQQKDEAAGIAVDAQGSIYIAGRTMGTLEWPERSDRGVGNWDIFAAKYSPAGTLTWLKQYGTTNQDVTKHFAVDPQGFSYIVGSTLGAIDYYDNRGKEDGFILKLDSNGMRQWARQVGTPAMDESVAVAIERPTGMVYMVTNVYEEEMEITAARISIL